jgi:hypothetical protein
MEQLASFAVKVEALLAEQQGCSVCVSTLENVFLGFSCLKGFETLPSPSGVNEINNALFETPPGNFLFKDEGTTWPFRRACVNIEVRLLNFTAQEQGKTIPQVFSCRKQTSFRPNFFSHLLQINFFSPCTFI